MRLMSSRSKEITIDTKDSTLGPPSRSGLRVDIEDIVLAKPTHSPVTISPPTLLNYFLQLMSIKATIIEFCADLGISLELDDLHLNPSCHQTENNGGIAIIFHNNKPEAFCTPLGELAFAPYLLETISLEMLEAFQALQLKLNDQYGLQTLFESEAQYIVEDLSVPAYAIYTLLHDINGLEIAPAKLLDHSGYIAFAEARNHWDIIFDELRYEENRMPRP